MPIYPAKPDMIDPIGVTEHNREIIRRDMALIREKLDKYSRWEQCAPMFMSLQEWKEYHAIEEEYSGLVLGLLVDEVTLDDRYINGNWMMTKTLLDLIRKGLEAK